MNASWCCERELWNVALRYASKISDKLIFVQISSRNSFDRASLSSLEENKVISHAAKGYLQKNLFTRRFRFYANVESQKWRHPLHAKISEEDEVKLKMNFSLRLMQFDYKHSDETWELLTYFMWTCITWTRLKVSTWRKCLISKQKITSKTLSLKSFVLFEDWIKVF